MKYEKEKYFSCYSPNLKEYLERNGFEPITSFVHIRENKTCWVFEKFQSYLYILNSGLAIASKG